MNKRTTSGFLAAVMLATGLSLGMAPAAQAADKEKLYRIGTYIGGAGTIYALARGRGTWALIGGGATLLSYNQWKKEASRRRQRDRSLRAYRSYRTGWLQRHKGQRIRQVR